MQCSVTEQGKATQKQANRKAGQPIDETIKPTGLGLSVTVVLDQKRLPIFVAHPGKFAEEDHIRGPERRIRQFETSPLGGVIALARIAALASRHQIGPLGFATLGAGYHVVQCEFVPRSTINATIIVALEHIVPVEHHRFERDVGIIAQADDRWHIVGLRYRAEILVLHRVDYFCLVGKYQQKSFVNAAHRQRPVVGVQYEHFSTHNTYAVGMKIYCVSTELNF